MILFCEHKGGCRCVCCFGLLHCQARWIFVQTREIKVHAERFDWFLCLLTKFG